MLRELSGGVRPPEGAARGAQAGERVGSRARGVRASSASAPVTTSASRGGGSTPRAPAGMGWVHATQSGRSASSSRASRALPRRFALNVSVDDGVILSPIR